MQSCVPGTLPTSKGDRQKSRRISELVGCGPRRTPRQGPAGGNSAPGTPSRRSAPRSAMCGHVRKRWREVSHQLSSSDVRGDVSHAGTWSSGAKPRPEAIPTASNSSTPPRQCSPTRRDRPLVTQADQPQRPERPADNNIHHNTEPATLPRPTVKPNQSAADRRSPRPSGGRRGAARRFSLAGPPDVMPIVIA